jgi:hypothetical protein
MSTVDLVSCLKSRRPCSLKSLLTSPMEAVEVEVFSSSQGSRKVNLEKSSLAYSFLVHAHNLQILRLEQGSKPKIDRSFWLSFSCCYRERRAFYTKLPRSYPHHDQFFRPLDLICVSFTTLRHSDATPPSSSLTLLTAPRPHELTIVELRVVDTRYPAG